MIMIEMNIFLVSLQKHLNILFMERFSFIISILTAIVIPTIIYIVQQHSRKSQLFNNCAKSLYSDNQIEQATAAILLRGFLKKKQFFFHPDYSKETKNLMVALLRNTLPVTLQKIIADSFSFVDDLRGQDMQYVNMLGALIKPESRVQYELYRDEKNKDAKLSMQNADFFHSVLQECSINSVNASNAIFMYSILCGTSFRNCILDGARFDGANLNGVKFDEDCSLIGAHFKGAIGLDNAFVRIKGTSTQELPLLDFLDARGQYQTQASDSINRYKTEEQSLTIFVSKLGAMDTEQRMHYNSVINTIKEYKGFSIKTIEREDYSVVSQLTDIVTNMEGCDGCIIFAFEYMRVGAGIIHGKIIGNDRQIIKDTAFASPWLHIEAALANGMHMPCLIVYDEGICRDGMFDEVVIESDKNMYAIPYSDSLSSQDSTLKKWYSHVMEYNTKNSL